jgi:hypothetical protein
VERQLGQDVDFMFRVLWQASMTTIAVPIGKVEAASHVEQLLMLTLVPVIILLAGLASLGASNNVNVWKREEQLYTSQDISNGHVEVLSY